MRWTKPVPSPDVGEVVEDTEVGAVEGVEASAGGCVLPGTEPQVPLARLRAVHSYNPSQHYGLTRGWVQKFKGSSLL